ncbi:hypothetical protein FACS1894188_09950 [Clostridia bacterium]|nr:hypothetical protein FACS1894188_09950 [Clostridia bacterium]
MFCNKCGNQLQKGTKFCNKCGTEQGDTQANAPSKIDIKSLLPAVAVPKIKIFAIAIILLIGLIGAITALRGGNSPDAKAMLKAVKNNERSGIL